MIVGGEAANASGPRRIAARMRVLLILIFIIRL
jgi:hypothetical protein